MTDVDVGNTPLGRFGDLTAIRIDPGPMPQAEFIRNRRNRDLSSPGSVGGRSDAERRRFADRALEETIEVVVSI